MVLVMPSGSGWRACLSNCRGCQWLGYQPDGRGFELRQELVILLLSRTSSPALGSTQPHLVLTRDCFLGVKAAGEWGWPLPYIYLVPRLRILRFQLFAAMACRGTALPLPHDKIQWEVVLVFSTAHLFFRNILQHNFLARWCVCPISAWIWIGDETSSNKTGWYIVRQALKEHFPVCRFHNIQQVEMALHE